MHDDRWLRVFCQDLRVYDEQQARDGWTRDERDAWITRMILDARDEIRRRGFSWSRFLGDLERESPHLRALAPDVEGGKVATSATSSASRIDDPDEAERVARALITKLIDAQCPELTDVEIARARFRFDRRVRPDLARAGIFDRTLDAMIARHLGVPEIQGGGPTG